MARCRFHTPSKQTYSNQQNAKRAAGSNPKATGEVEQLESGRWVYLVDVLLNRAEMEEEGIAELRALSDVDRQNLLTRHNWTISNGKVYLTCPRQDDEQDRRFVITGPTGTHTLLATATDADRLNAHWQVFTSHDRNRKQLTAALMAEDA